MGCKAVPYDFQSHPNREIRFATAAAGVSAWLKVVAVPPSCLVQRRPVKGICTWQNHFKLQALVFTHMVSTNAKGEDMIVSAFW